MAPSRLRHSWQAKLPSALAYETPCGNSFVRHLEGPTDLSGTSYLAEKTNPGSCRFAPTTYPEASSTRVGIGFTPMQGDWEERGEASFLEGTHGQPETSLHFLKSG